MAAITRSLVIPVYRNEASIPELLTAVRGIAAVCGLDSFEVIYVVDGSPDNSYKLLKDALPNEGFQSQLLLLSRNFGSFLAIRAGMSVARGNYCALMAADLQEPPDLVLGMFAILEEENHDIVVGQRINRDDPLFSRTSAAIFWYLYRKLVEPNIPKGGVDVFACNRDVLDALSSMQESHSSLIGQLFWIGFRRKEITYDRRARRHGKSSWSVAKKLRYFSDSLFSFTDLPIQFLLISGFLGVSVSVLFGIFAVGAKLSGLIQVPGYTATILTILFFGASAQFGLGIVGSYTWRAYENTKQRPQFIIMRKDSFEAPGIQRSSVSNA